MKLKLGLLLIGLLSFSALDLCAKEKQQTLCIPDSPPYSGSQLKNNGPLTEVVVQAFALSGIKIKTVNASWARLIHDAENGECILLGIWSTAERREKFHFSTHPVIRQDLGLYFQKGKSLEDSQGGILALQRSSYITPALLEQPWKIYEITNPSQGLGMLASQRVDAVFAEIGHATHLIGKDLKLTENLDQTPHLLETKLGYLAIAKSHPDAEQILMAFDRNFTQLLYQLGSEKPVWLP